MTSPDALSSTGVRSGLLCGLGAVGETDFGFFDRAQRRYVVRTFAGEHEIGSLVGNLYEVW